MAIPYKAFLRRLCRFDVVKPLRHWLNRLSIVLDIVFRLLSFHVLFPSLNDRWVWTDFLHARRYHTISVALFSIVNFLHFGLGLFFCVSRTQFRRLTSILFHLVGEHIFSDDIDGLLRELIHFVLLWYKFTFLSPYIRRLVATWIFLHYSWHSGVLKCLHARPLTTPVWIITPHNIRILSIIFLALNCQTLPDFKAAFFVHWILFLSMLGSATTILFAVFTNAVLWAASETS